MSRKRLIVLGFVAVLLVAAIIVPTLLRGSSKHSTQPTKKGLVITNINQYSDEFDATAIPQMEQTIFDRIKSSTKQPASYYTAAVRSGSFTIQYNPYEATDPPMSVPTVNFLVDIPAAQRTYAVKFSGGTNYPYKILYVLCPSKEQNRYASFPCQDPTQ